jgi:hypothetical protein
VTPKTILARWIDRYGDLTPELQRRFLTKDRIVDELSKLPDSAVIDALGQHQKLIDILGAVRADPASRRQPSPPRPSTERTSTVRRFTGSNNLSEAFDGHRPQRPVDADLMKRIGPVQQYDDVF